MEQNLIKLMAIDANYYKCTCSASRGFIVYTGNFRIASIKDIKMSDTY